jgi:hypothetical protein
MFEFTPLAMKKKAKAGKHLEEYTHKICQTGFSPKYCVMVKKNIHVSLLHQTVAGSQKRYSYQFKLRKI